MCQLAILSLRSFFQLHTVLENYDRKKEKSQGIDDVCHRGLKLVLCSNSWLLKTLYGLKMLNSLCKVVKIDHSKVLAGVFKAFFAGNDSTFASRARTRHRAHKNDPYRCFKCIKDQNEWSINFVTPKLKNPCTFSNQ